MKTLYSPTEYAQSRKAIETGWSVSTHCYKLYCPNGHQSRRLRRWGQSLTRMRQARRRERAGRARRLSAAFFAVYRNPVLSRPAVEGESKAVRAVEAWRGFRYNAPTKRARHSTTRGFDTTRHKTASHSTAAPRLNLPLASLTVLLASSAGSGGCECALSCLLTCVFSPNSRWCPNGHQSRKANETWCWGSPLRSRVSSE